MSEEIKPHITDLVPWQKHVELLASMVHGELIEQGHIEPGAFINNLHMIADRMETMCVTAKDIEDWSINK